MRRNKKKFLQHFREIRAETENRIANTINLDWTTVKQLLETDRRIIKNLFHNLQNENYNVKQNKEKFLHQFREIRDETENCIANTINLDWKTVEEFLEMDRKILEKLFHNLQKLENETMDLFNDKS